MSVVKLAERVAEVWYGSGRPGDDAEAVGVVAALCLLVWPSTMGPDADRAVAMLNRSTDDQIADLLAQAWAAFWAIRPELAFRCGCFGEWLNAEPRDPQRVRAAAQIARTAIKAGLWSGRLAHEDVIGTVWTHAMRSNKARQARGEFYTPPNVTYMMARMSLGSGIESGQSICDPCAGTGGMFLGASRALRDDGKDPADFWWYGNDISHVSVAGLCVNAHIWGLGRQVVIGCADSLAEADRHVRAWNEQRAAVDQHTSMVRAAQMLALLRGLDDGEENAAAAPGPAPVSVPGGPPPGPDEDGVLVASNCAELPAPPARPARSPAARPARTPDPAETLTLF